MQPSGPEFEDVQERLADLVASGDVAGLEAAVSEIHPSDLADLVEALGEEEQVPVRPSPDPPGQERGRGEQEARTTP